MEEYELTPEERERLDVLKKFAEEQSRKPAKSPSQPAKYNYVPGFDDQGRKYPVRERKTRQDPPKTDEN